MTPEEKTQLEKKASLNLLLGSAAASLTGAEEASKTRKRLDRLKAKGGVDPQVPGSVPMPIPGEPMSAAYGAQKTAGAMDVVRAAGGNQILVGAGIALVGGAGAALAGELIRGAGNVAGGVMSSIQRKRLFSNIMQKNPEFRQTEAKKDLAEKYFNLIMNYAPALSRDETAITDFMRRQLVYQTSSVEFIKQLADLEAIVRGKVDPHSTAARVSGSATRTLESYLGGSLSKTYAGGG
jgi:hypothetical protein